MGCDSISKRSREREQMDTQTDEVYREHWRKTEEFGTEWCVKIPRKTSKKVLDKWRRVC